MKVLRGFCKFIYKLTGYSALILAHSFLFMVVTTDFHNQLQTHEYLTDNPEFRAVVTAYSSSPDETNSDPFITASGDRVRHGIVACSREFPFGSKFLIDGQVYECLDRLSRKFDDRIDIWMPSKEAAISYGKRVLFVEVLNENDSSTNRKKRG